MTILYEKLLRLDNLYYSNNLFKPLFLNIINQSKNRNIIC